MARPEVVDNGCDKHGDQTIAAVRCAASNAIADAVAAMRHRLHPTNPRTAARIGIGSGCCFRFLYAMQKPAIHSFGRNTACLYPLDCCRLEGAPVITRYTPAGFSVAQGANRRRAPASSSKKSTRRRPDVPIRPHFRTSDAVPNKVGSIVKL